MLSTNKDDRAPDQSHVRQPNLRHVEFVSGFHQLTALSFSENVNAVCWKRNLPGDFAEVVTCLREHYSPVVTLDSNLLHQLPLSEQGRIAVDVMLADFHLLSERNLDPALNCIFDYPRDERSGPITTDVFSFHVDSAPCATDTWLCTYHGLGSEGLCNDDARRHVDIPATRAALLAAYGGSDDAGFQDFLSDNAYDLHFSALPQTRPFSFGVGHLWRIATQYPDSVAPPCIHRAPPHSPGDQPRLLLIS